MRAQFHLRAGHWVNVMDHDASVWVAVTGPWFALTPDEAERYASALMDAAARARMVATDPKGKT